MWNVHGESSCQLLQQKNHRVEETPCTSPAGELLREGYAIPSLRSIYYHIARWNIGILHGQTPCHPKPRNPKSASRDGH